MNEYHGMLNDIHKVSEMQTGIELLIAQWIDAINNAMPEYEYSGDPGDIERYRFLVDQKASAGAFIEEIVDRAVELENVLYDPDMPMGTGISNRDRGPNEISLRDSIKDANKALYGMHE